MKRIGILLAIFLGVLLIAGIALPFLVDINKFKDPILEKVRERTGEDIRVGHISWSAMPFLAVQLENVDLASGNGGPSLFRARGVEVVLRWAPLLRKEVELKKIVLLEPQLTIRKDAEGKIALGGKAAERAPAVHKPSETAAPPAEARAERDLSIQAPGTLERMRLDSLQIVDGVVHYEEMHKGGKAKTFQLQKLHATGSGIAMNRKIDFTCRATLADGKRNLAFKVNGWVGPINDDMVRRSAWGDMPAEITFSAQDMDSEALEDFLPAAIQLKGQADVDMHVSRDAQKLEYDMEFTGDDLLLRIPGKVQKPQGAVLRLNASGDIKGARVHIAKASAKLASAKVSVRDASYDKQTHDVEGHIEAVAHLEDLLEWADRSQANMAQATARGKLDMDLDFSGNTDSLADFQAEGDIRFEGLYLQWPGILKRPVTAEGSAQLQRDSIRLNAMQFRVGKSDLRVDGKIHLKGEAPGQVRLESTHLDIQECLDVLEMPAKQPGVNGSRAQSAGAKQPAAVAAPPQTMKALPAGAVPGGTAAPAQTGPSGSHAEGIGKWNLEGDCNIKELVYGNNVLSGLQGHMLLQNSVLTLSRFAAGGYQGKISTALQLDLASGGMPFRWGIRMTDIEINDVIAANSNFGGRVYGKWNGQLELTGQAEGYPGGPLYSLNGNGQVKVLDMRIQTFDLMKSLSLITGLLGIATESTNETRLDQVTTSVQVGAGRVATPDLQALARNYTLTARGSFGFDRTLDYTAQVHLPPQTASRLGRGQLVQALLASDGSMTIPFAIRGRLDGPPKFEPMWQDLLAREATHFLQRQLLRGRQGTAQQGGTQTAEDSGQGSAGSALEDLMLQMLKK